MMQTIDDCAAKDRYGICIREVRDVCPHEKRRNSWHAASGEYQRFVIEFCDDCAPVIEHHVYGSRRVVRFEPAVLEIGLMS